jgi:hypothetical protein
LGKPEEEVKESRNNEAQELEDGNNVVFRGRVQSLKSSGNKERSSVTMTSQRSIDDETNEKERRKESQDGGKSTKETATVDGSNQNEMEENENTQEIEIVSTQNGNHSEEDEEILEENEENEDLQVEEPQQVPRSVVVRPQLKKNDMVQYRGTDDDDYSKGMLYSRAGKAKGPLCHWWNVKDMVTGHIQAMDLSIVSEIQRIDDLPVKNTELSKEGLENVREEYNVYEEVEDGGRKSNLEPVTYTKFERAGDEKKLGGLARMHVDNILHIGEESCETTLKDLLGTKVENIPDQVENELKERNLSHRSMEVIVPVVDYIPSREIDSDDDAEEGKTKTTEQEVV